MLHSYNPSMSEPLKPSPAVPAPAQPSKPCLTDKVLCERCGKEEMFRMHAVWRCPGCGYKTDCCGW